MEFLGNYKGLIMDIVSSLPVLLLATNGIIQSRTINNMQNSIMKLSDDVEILKDRIQLEGIMSSANNGEFVNDDGEKL